MLKAHQQIGHNESVIKDDWKLDMIDAQGALEKNVR